MVLENPVHHTAGGKGKFPVIGACGRRSAIMVDQEAESFGPEEMAGRLFEG